MNENDRLIISVPLDLSEVVAICLTLSKALPTILFGREALGIGPDELLLLSDFNNRLAHELENILQKYSPEDLKVVINNGRRDAIQEAQKRIGKEVQEKTGIRLPPPYSGD